MTDYNQELYWREYQHRVAMAAAAAASSRSELDIAKTEFVKSAFAKNVTPEEKEAAVKALLKTANGKEIYLADSDSAEGATVSAQFKIIMDTLSTATADEKLVANISLPEDANISTTSSYVVPTGVTLTIGTYASKSVSPRDSETYTISCSDHLFKAEGGSITINDGKYKVSGSNKYVIRAGINPTISRKIEDALSSTVTINGGTFESDSYVMTHWGNSTTTVNRGTFKSPSSIFAGNGNAWCANANLTINGGNFILENNNVDPEGYTAVIGYWPVGNGKLIVEGGTFTIDTPQCPATIFAVRAGNAEITGGTYTISSCDTSLSGKVGDAKTILPSGMFTVTSNTGYQGEPTATIAANTNNKPEGVADIVVLDSDVDPNFDALLGDTDQSKYSSIKKYILKEGIVTEYTESNDEEVTQV